MGEKKARSKLKPVVYSSCSYARSGANNTTQQILLLKALRVTQDPRKLKTMIGVKSMAQVYRTLDKLAMRKEYHAALNRAGISFDYIVKGLKDIAEKSSKDKVRLGAFQTILKSVGMDKYSEQDQGTSGSWEEILLKKINKEKEQKEEINEGIISKGEEIPSELEIYSVNKPEVPKSERLIEEAEKAVLGNKSVYDSK